MAGGGAVTVEFAPGYRVSGLAHLLGHLDARVIVGMDLERHGLAFAATGLATTAVSASGDHLRLEGAAGARLTGRIAPEDVQAWDRLRARLMAFAAALAPIRAMTPPRLARGAANEVLRLARIGLGLRRLGRDEFREFLRMILINVADVAEDELSDDRLRRASRFRRDAGRLARAAFAELADPLPRPAGGRDVGAAGGAGLAEGRHGHGRGGDGARRRGGGGRAAHRRPGRADRWSRTTAPWASRSTDGEEIRADLVVSAIEPAGDLASLVGPRHLDTGFLRQTAAIRVARRGGQAASGTDRPPDFRGADMRTRLVIAPSVNAVEAAFNPVKYGEVPERAGDGGHPALGP